MSKLDDKLARLLRQADAAATAPQAPADLAARVRRRADGAARTDGAARVRRRAWLAAAVLLGAIGLAWLGPFVRSTPDESAPAAGREPVGVRREIARLRMEAEQRLRLIEAFRSQQSIRTRIAALEREVATPLPDPRAAARASLERAAQTLVAQGDRLLHELKLSRAARQRYRRAVELYPETPSAGVARWRLRRMDQSTL